ncbi:MAG: hypothetical protein EOP85_16270 [Verrucomicrobiaceae bacterium]|nr:MAG: hypothetical protein EOP85_16270 [Verrucomicrobiaceae bacterium]
MSPHEETAAARPDCTCENWITSPRNNAMIAFKPMTAGRVKSDLRYSNYYFLQGAFLLMESTRNDVCS